MVTRAGKSQKLLHDAASARLDALGFAKDHTMQEPGGDGAIRQPG